MSEPFIGEIRMFTYSFAPRDWAYCAGQTLPIAQNTSLYAVIGLNYGGDGRQTVGLPNLQGRAPMHVGGPSNTGPGLSRHTIGETWGFNSIDLTEANLPAHDHHIKATKTKPENNEPANQLPAKHKDSGGKGKIFVDENIDLDSQFNIQAVGPAGGKPTGEAHENRQPYLATPFCIALDGIFPSRS